MLMLLFWLSAVSLFLQRHYYIAVEVGAGETDSKIRTKTQAGLNRVGGVNRKKRNEKKYK